MNRLSPCGPADEKLSANTEINQLFDPESITALGGGDQALIERLVAGVIQSNRDDLAALESLLAKEDRMGLAALAHRTKGTAKMINAAVLVDACQALEACAGHAALAQLRANGDEFCELLRRMEAALQARFPGAQGKA